MSAAGAVNGATVDLAGYGATWGVRSHPAHELLWSVSGAATVDIGDEVYTITPHLGLWIPAGVRHSGFTPQGTRYRAVQFNIEPSPRLAGAALPIEISPLLRLLLKRLANAELGESSRTLSEAMVLDVMQPACTDLRVRTPTSPLIGPIATALRECPATALSLEQWADHLGVSTKTITRAFRAETGLSFSRWRSAVRVQHAVVLLAAGVEVEDVAYRTGYQSTSAFGAAFRRVTDKTPGFFRPREE